MLFARAAGKRSLTCFSLNKQAFGFPNTKQLSGKAPPLEPDDDEEFLKLLEGAGSSATNTVPSLDPALLEKLQHFSDNLHNYGFTWSTAIVGSTLLSRVFTFPLYSNSVRQGALQSKYANEIDGWMTKLNKAKLSGSRTEFKNVELEFGKFAQTLGLHSTRQQMNSAFLKISVLASQLYVWSFLAKYKLSGMSTEGLLWFTDLTKCDPTFILPCFASFAVVLWFLMKFEQGVIVKTSHKWVFRSVLLFGIAPVSLLLFAKSTSAFLLCFSTHITVSLILLQLFRMQTVKKLFKIPLTVADVNIEELRGSRTVSGQIYESYHGERRIRRLNYEHNIEDMKKRGKYRKIWDPKSWFESTPEAKDKVESKELVDKSVKTDSAKRLK